MGLFSARAAQAQAGRAHRAEPLLTLGEKGVCARLASPLTSDWFLCPAEPVKLSCPPECSRMNPRLRPRWAQASPQLVRRAVSWTQNR